jgi:hypothetical protein
MNKQLKLIQILGKEESLQIFCQFKIDSLTNTMQLQLAESEYNKARDIDHNIYRLDIPRRQLQKNCVMEQQQAVYPK